VIAVSGADGSWVCCEKLQAKSASDLHHAVKTANPKSQSESADILQRTVEGTVGPELQNQYANILQWTVEGTVGPELQQAGDVLQRAVESTANLE